MFQQEYEVQKGRTVTCKMGVAHAGAKLTLAHFSGEDNEDKQKNIDKIVELGSLKLVPLTDAQKETLAKAEAAQKESSKKEEARKNAILEADFDSMNKDPMIDFAKEWSIELKGSKADEIREELKAYQDILLSTDGE
jgi:hypothetical protein